MVNGFVIVRNTIKDSCLKLLVKILLVIEIVLMLISLYLLVVIVKKYVIVNMDILGRVLTTKNSGIMIKMFLKVSAVKTVL
jgi:hypothetical protein